MGSKRTTLLLVILSTFTFSKGQQSLDSTFFRFKIDNESSLLFMHSRNATHKVYIDNTSDKWGNIITNNSKQTTDNPLFHTAFYSLLKTETSHKEKYKVELDLLFEHRGMSYGFYDMDNVVFYPYYKFSIDETLNIDRERIKISGDIGSYRQGKLHKGLKIYNLDYHGGNIAVNWKKFSLEYTQIGDLSNGIGLNIDELYDFTMGYNLHNSILTSFNFGFNITSIHYAPFLRDSILFKYFNFKYNRLGNHKYSNYGCWAEFVIKEASSLYLQYEVRSAPYKNIRENSAFLIGGKFDFNFTKTKITFNPEFRYYGWAYNYGHRDDLVQHRNNLEDTLNYYSNTVGRNLYPLMNYNNKFSQWAVYTDYQYQNIAGIENRLLFNKRVSDFFHLDAKVESSTFIKEYSMDGKKTFTYFYYTLAFIYSPIEQIGVSMGLTNKVMNLDKHYQTFYMIKNPMMIFNIRYNLNKI